MKKIAMLSFILCCLLVSASPAAADAARVPGRSEKHIGYDMIFEQADAEILSRILNTLRATAVTEITPADVGRLFIGTPYVADTLEMTPEKLVINLRELDCTTFVQACIAIARLLSEEGRESPERGRTKTADDFMRYADILKDCRYRDGVIDGYTSRLHYTCDWIADNAERGLLEDMTQELGGVPLNKRVNFMTENRRLYAGLADDDEFIRTKAIEDDINKLDLLYIPKDRVKQTEGMILEGDVISITSNVPGEDVTHMGLAVKVNGRLHLLHAAVRVGVVISEKTLDEYLRSSERRTGITVCRMKIKEQ